MNKMNEGINLGTCIDEAIVEVKAKQGGAHASLLGDRGSDSRPNGGER